MQAIELAIAIMLPSVSLSVTLCSDVALMLEKIKVVGLLSCYY